MFHLHSSPPKLHLRSTPAPSQTHPGFNMCVKLPSWSCSTKFRSQDSCLAFIHEPSPSRSINLHLSPIEVASQFNPGHIHISPPYKHPYQSLSFIQVVSHLNPGPYICISLPSRGRLTSIHVRKNAAQLHPGPISNPYWSASSPSRSCLTCIQVKRFLYHRDPCTVSPPPKSHITFCPFTRCAPQVHQCPVSTPSKAPRFVP